MSEKRQKKKIVKTPSCEPDIQVSLMQHRINSIRCDESLRLNVVFDILMRMIT